MFNLANKDDVYFITYDVSVIHKYLQLCLKA